MDAPSIIQYLNDYFTYVQQYDTEIWRAIGETFVMVGISIAAAVFLGLPVGTVLFLCRKGQLYENRPLFSVMNGLVNIIRSFPSCCWWSS